VVEIRADGVENPAVPRIEVFKALGDNTRYAIYLELARSPRPLATSEIAETLGLHPNTVRPHLERMRDVGLLVVEVDARGEVGRPQHRYSLSDEAPSLGLEPPTMPLLAGLMTEVAALAGAGALEAVEIGRTQGRATAVRYRAAPSCLEALVSELDQLGFDPAVGAAAEPADSDTAVVAFAHCPYRALAEAHPELVCALHQGVVEGFVATMGDASVAEFCNLAHRTPCQVAISPR
jgi:predicted ArsR family transcriptional regulator